METRDSEIPKHNDSGGLPCVLGIRMENMEGYISGMEIELRPGVVNPVNR